MSQLPHWARSAATVEDYADLVRRLGRRFVPEGETGVRAWIGWLEQLRLQLWSGVTVRRYRAALLWFLESLDQFPNSPLWIAPEHREKIEAAIRLPWAGEAITLPEKKKLPGKRMRSFGAQRGDGRDRWTVLRGVLESRDAWETVLWMEAVMRVGVRPIEWVRGVSFAGGRLTVPCAKGAFAATGARIRGLQEERELDLSGWPESEQVLIATWAGLRGMPEERAALLRQMAKQLRGAWDQAFGNLRPRITLYTARHQFAANLRSAGVAPQEIAAMMGHSSDQTQRTHYGRGARGRKGKGPEDNIMLPKVSDQLVRQVRRHVLRPYLRPFQ